MTQMIAEYQGDEIQVTFVARGEREDYGVPGSPSWMEPHDIEVASVTILGARCDVKMLPDPVAKAVASLKSEVEWEDAS